LQNDVEDLVNLQGRRALSKKGTNIDRKQQKNVVERALRKVDNITGTERTLVFTG